MRVLAITLVTACYSPSARDCEYRCSPTNECPTGLACASGFCRTEPTPMTSCMPVDGGDGDGGGDAALCGFGAFAPTHFDPCAVANMITKQSIWTIGGAGIAYNTTDGSGPGAPL